MSGVEMPQDFGRVDLYLGQELARLDVGPMRACYLVPDFNRGRLIEAITAASRRWGGVTEPILATGPGGFTDGHWQQIVEALKPDLFVDLGLDEQARAAVTRQLGKSLTSWPEFTGEPPGFNWLWCHPLVIDGAWRCSGAIPAGEPAIFGWRRRRRGLLHVERVRPGHSTAR